MDTTERTRLLARIGLGGISLFAVMAGLLHALMARDEPWRMSEFANSAYAPLWFIGAYGLALGSICILLALAPSLPSGRASRVALGLLGIAAVGSVLIASFPTDVGPAHSPSGHIHEQALAPTFTSLGAAMAVLGSVFARSAAWRKLANFSFVLGACVGVFAAIYLVSGVVGTIWVMPAQRLLVASILAWLGLVGMRLAQKPNAALLPGLTAKP